MNTARHWPAPAVLAGVGTIAGTAHRGANSNAALFDLEHIEGRPEIPASRVWLAKGC